jgi:hypothetical protein
MRRGVRQSHDIGKHPRVILRRGYFPLLLSVAVSAATLSACGSSGPTDKDQIATIIKREGTHPSTLCSHLTSPMLARLGGMSGCLRQASSAAVDPTTHATSIKVSGHTATAVVVDRIGTRPISLVKQKGVWKVAGVG